MGLRSLIPTAVKRRLRDGAKRARGAYIRKRYPFDKLDFKRALERVGVKSGDVLMVHSSYDKFEGFRGTPVDVIQALQEAVTTSGTIMMPTMPFTGSAHEWVESGQILDVRRTPSRMGLVTELFRRSPGVIRTVHPTHPVAIWGSRAAEMSRDSHTTTTLCGRPGPFARLADVGGKSLLLGTGIEAMTCFHAVEELLEPEMPFSPFTEESYDLQTRDSQGNLVSSRMRLLNRHYSKRRRAAIMRPELERQGEWHELTVGRLSVLLLSAAAALKACQAMAKQGVYCYDP
jgi:aminoglycoside 3-N-acetyltransferase